MFIGSLTDDTPINAKRHVNRLSGEAFAVLCFEAPEMLFSIHITSLDDVEKWTRAIEEARAILGEETES